MGLREKCYAQNWRPKKKSCHKDTTDCPGGSLYDH